MLAEIDYIFHEIVTCCKKIIINLIPVFAYMLHVYALMIWYDFLVTCYKTIITNSRLYVTCLQNSGYKICFDVKVDKTETERKT